MPVFLKDDDLSFPDYDEADDNGILALGGDFSSERLLKAYAAGIFPWPHEGLPLLWFFPEPRFVLKPCDLIINKSLRKELRRTTLHLKADNNFLGVIRGCQRSKRPEQSSTWISDEMTEAYHELHRLGYAHSIEAYREDRLVGGLYGVSLGTIFFGESMFHEEPYASKLCFVTLVAQLIQWQFSLIDCQMPTHTLEQFGARAIKSTDFVRFLKESQAQPTRRGPWQLSVLPQELGRVFNRRDFSHGSLGPDPESTLKRNASK